MNNHNKFPPTNVIAIDVDGTLIVRNQLNKELAEWAKEMRRSGFEVTLWSTQGRDYAKAIANKFNVADCFEYYASKPSYIVDDLGWSWVKYTKVLKRLIPLKTI
jgi:predicted HAD superfamily phosphohydrolase YqeG